MLALAACSGAQATSTSAAAGMGTTASINEGVRLAVGTLKLEGTGQAVTTQQAAALLPLWKALKNMSANSSSSQIEIQALYDQIQETMTAGQAQAIDALDLTAANVGSVMAGLGIQQSGGGQAASSSASSSSAASSGGQGGGVPPADMGGGMGPGGDIFGGPPASSQTTTTTAGASRGSQAGSGVQTALYEAVIQVLETRASA
jgi:hypothetical protein